MGLSIAYGIVAALGGWLEVLSEGQGTCVCVVLPVNSQSTEAEDAGKVPATLLIVDDEPLILRAIVRVLQGWDYHLLSAETPARALELAEAA
ncbi:MAG: hybrid sensor histidine kinase/response regulator, partial [Deltaproteobacteria bacterium]|nr:hybrid sensor histidine kinase/response regulator [Deltaproteobacteria bacterium]